MKKYKAIIFDVGDTLVKWFPNRATIYYERLREIGVDLDQDDALAISNAIYRAEGEQSLQAKNGTPHITDEEFIILKDKAALSCIAQLPEPFEVLMKKMSNIPLPIQVMKVIPGVRPMLHELKDAGYRLAIVSNHYAWLLDFLKTEKLDDFFESIIVSEIVGIEKPDERIMQIVLDKLSLLACDCLYVGDHEMDVLCAKKAGLDMAWIAPPDAELLSYIPYKEDYRIASVNEVINIINE